MTPEEIVERIARMTNPNKSSEPLDSEQALVRLIQECRDALSPRVTRQRARMYDHETAAYMHEMLRIERAPAEDVRDFARDIVDILWGVGSGGSKGDPRHLDFGKEWDVDAIEEVALRCPDVACRLRAGVEVAMLRTAFSAILKPASARCDAITSEPPKPKRAIIWTRCRLASATEARISCGRVGL